MRINTLVTGFINSNADKIAFMKSLDGGYERWFQLELAYHYVKEYYKYPNYSLLEVPYPNGKQRCDLVFKNDTTGDIIELEIKCQTKNESLDIFKNHLFDDIKKMKTAGKHVYVLGVLKEASSVEKLRNEINRKFPNYAESYKQEIENIGFVLAINLIDSPAVTNSDDIEMEE